jgi:dihydrofolate reductase
VTDIVIHVAMAENGVIGRDGDMPWKLSTDLKRFKAQTMGKPVVMGRKTFESIGRPLPGRLNIVVTRDPTWRADGVETVHSLDAALTLARTRGRCMAAADAICIIGGGEIYAQAISSADRLHVTHVLATIDGDTHFPAIDPVMWRAVGAEEHPASEKDSHATRHVVYKRVGTSRG